jgi:hypothetical protein
MNDKIKSLIIVIGAIVLQTTVYYTGRQFGSRAYLLGNTIDLKIPYISGFVYFYISWYILIFLVPYMISRYDQESFFKHMTTLALSLFITLIAFIAFPTTMERYVITTNTLNDQIVKAIYAKGSVLCCAPSLHILLTSLFMFPIFKNTAIPNLFKICTYIVSIGIILSTVLIKQHVFIDIPISIFVNVICWAVVDKFRLQRYLKEIYFSHLGQGKARVDGSPPSAGASEA